MLRKFNSWLVLLLTTIIIIASLFFINVYSFYVYSLNDSSVAILHKIEHGSSFRKIVRELKAASIIKMPLTFEFLVGLHGYQQQLKAGEYAIEKGMTAKQLLDKLVAGEVVQHSFTIIEGWSFPLLWQRMQESGYFRITLQDRDPMAIMAAIGHANEHPEGRFFPETYHFASGLRDVDFLKLAYNAMQEKLDHLWPDRMQDLYYATQYEALILASIVEKETSILAEYPLIARVFLSRLEKKMRLQADPCVAYGISPTFSGALSKANLRNKNPYNTYLHHGLPPTPIAMPSFAALYAVLHPLESDALYFVADGHGGHYFSSTLPEHKEAVARYRKKKNG